MIGILRQSKDTMLISGEKLVMVVGGREGEIDERGEILEKLNDEKIRMETCCITDVHVVVNSLPDSRYLWRSGVV